MKNQQGGRAFPSPGLIEDGKLVDSGGGGGMLLRDYFAAKAMAALITASTTLDEDDSGHYGAAQAIGICCPNGEKEIDDKGADIREFSFSTQIASDAYLIADAMIAERDRAI